MNTPHPTPDTEGRIDCEVRGHVLLICINRPAKRNGFTARMFRELAEAYTTLDDDPALPRYRRRTKPMVVAVKGITFTVGIELMLAADIVVAADDCRFSQLEVKRGIMATGGATLRMAERSGLGNAMLHLLTGDEFGAAEAYRLNYVQKVVEPAQVLPEALQIAEQIAAQAPLAVVATRMNVLRVLEEGPMAAMREFETTQKRLANSDDAAEGVRSFVEKRAARFVGH